MKVKVTHGTDTTFELAIPDGATVETVLKDATVVTICGEQGSARVNTTEVPVNTPLREGDTVEPVTVANEKAA